MSRLIIVGNGPTSTEDSLSDLAEVIGHAEAYLVIRESVAKPGEDELDLTTAQVCERVDALTGAQPSDWTCVGFWPRVALVRYESALVWRCNYEHQVLTLEVAPRSEDGEREVDYVRIARVEMDLASAEVPPFASYLVEVHRKAATRAAHRGPKAVEQW